MASVGIFWDMDSCEPEQSHHLNDLIISLKYFSQNYGKLKQIYISSTKITEKQKNLIEEIHYLTLLANHFELMIELYGFVLETKGRADVSTPFPPLIPIKIIMITSRIEFAKSLFYLRGIGCSISLMCSIHSPIVLKTSVTENQIFQWPPSFSQIQTFNFKDSILILI
ncbi:hypothetical protein M0811_08986 [Anaeramoeba ignava]|uniref:NYN domain-containing protein n=1 Tax=Anaeramoeba ignava TaxID=1746090 RepID=A0A9Q0RAH2_ANAIG|nr:hypothetical protein M0811_08986 [Anaeramoeba ignava]